MYTFKNTEINNKKASDFETKSMLYLLGMREDSESIELITVDCFNDVTGIDSQFSKLWDVQSKNHSSLPPSKIGESLYTLYTNYVSNFDFYQYILFIPKLKKEYLIDDRKNIYGYNNIDVKKKKGIEKKLKQKINNDDSGDTPFKFEEFLHSVVFVQDNKQQSTYIKSLSKFRKNRSFSNELYNKIFDEIRDIQSSLKNSYIENEIINHPEEVKKYNRHIFKSDINTLIISRLLGVDVFNSKGIPQPMFDYLKPYDGEQVKDILQDCNENLSRAFFDKNGCKTFWKVSEHIIRLVKEFPRDTSVNIMEKLKENVKINVVYLTDMTLIYMISLVKEGFENEV
ncbi:hypothetical protein [Vibrio coralliilyticus]|uniref:hypothetical protein n=1 Tax=Vibrio coralliilyticus TaxID=190893 RepID=UPI00148E266C|nr:hypothetical protein [Vibrio coralliilyticus]NOI31560.1 hypothetical protein [Vibrio coralliilyticus]NOI50980.1 hypothetical protein [Vibrio coralliilyticus]